ncbi:MAG: hypothetical protein AAF810_24085 [Cyanobacteria bacterium P01_D01_bin.36]
MQEAENIVQAATGLSAEEYRMLADFLTQRLKLAQAQENIKNIETAEAEENAQWSGKSILQIADELNAGVPAEEIAQHPKDGAAEHDHYIYGTPKRSAG